MIQPGLAGPDQELAKLTNNRFGLGDQVLLEVRLGGDFDAAAAFLEPDQQSNDSSQSGSR